MIQANEIKVNNFRCIGKKGMNELKKVLIEAGLDFKK